jgi:hypothetical protein
MTCIVKIIENGSGMRDFMDLSSRIYKGDSSWVPPLRSEVARTLDPGKNPYFFAAGLQKFICYRNNEPVARAMTVINPEHWKKFQKKTAFFGFFESTDDREAAALLFRAMEDHCSQKGAEFLEGPFNPNHYSELGLLVRNFESPAFFEPYNPPYYPDLLKRCGFETIYRIHTRVNRETGSLLSKKHKDFNPNRDNSGYTLRHFNLFDMKGEFERMREVFNDAFSENWHFLPVSLDEYRFAAKSLFAVTNPSLIQFVEHHEKPVAVLQCVLNINPLLRLMEGKIRFSNLIGFIQKRRSIKEVIVYAVGIKKAYQNSRAFVMLTEAMLQIARKYPVVYSTWISEDNTAAIRSSEIIGMKPYKWFEVYGKSI